MNPRKRNQWERDGCAASEQRPVPGNGHSGQTRESADEPVSPMKE
jgi:hypothetical protein